MGLIQPKAIDCERRRLAKVVVTIVVLIGFLVWLTSERSHVPSCINRPTDISASRK
jgi:hypothetical protein